MYYEPQASKCLSSHALNTANKKWVLNVLYAPKPKQSPVSSFCNQLCKCSSLQMQQKKNITLGVTCPAWNLSASMHYNASKMKKESSFHIDLLACVCFATLNDYTLLHTHKPHTLELKICIKSREIKWWMDNRREQCTYIIRHWECVGCVTCVWLYIWGQPLLWWRSMPSCFTQRKKTCSIIPGSELALLWSRKAGSVVMERGWGWR